MLSAFGISLSRGGQTILDDVAITVGPRTRTGLVGPNGIGKTTLLRILAGLEKPDSGTVERSPRTLTVGYLPQEPDAHAGETLRAYLARRTGIADAAHELDRLTELLADDPSNVSLGGRMAGVDAYTEALERFLALGGDDLDARAAQTCADVGLDPRRLDVEVGALSGGQAARAALAAILLSRFDVFLLDEPTNNLDFAGLTRLEHFLGAREAPATSASRARVERERAMSTSAATQSEAINAGVVVVSHDRAFLDRTVTRVVELQEESHRAVEYAGGWSEFVAARELARGQQYEAFEKYRATRRKLTDRIRTQREWSDRGAAKQKKRPRDHDRAQQGFFKDRTEKQAAKVRASERALQRLDTVDKPWEGWALRLSLAPSGRSGDVVARLDGAVIRRAAPERPGAGSTAFTLGPLDLEVAWQERVAILGPNGSGKTTLLRALLGELPLAAGTRWVGPGVVVGEMAQGRSEYGGDEPLLATFMTTTGLVVSEARSLLAKFALGAEHVDRAGASLSPGERTRAVLATLMARGVNCLVLDEPTNHLDVAAIEQLESALDAFDGTLLLVTHDRRFLDAVHVTRAVTLPPSR